MTPLFARWAAMTTRIQCWTGRHEWAAEVPTDPDGHRLPILRQRCLHRGLTSHGLDLASGPRYRLTQPSDRARLVLHNPRLKRCPCAQCEAVRATRRARRGKVTPMRRQA